MKIAIIHDDLMRRGGAEQVALGLHMTFPEAPIYTLCYQPDLTYPEFRKAKVITSIYQRLVKTEAKMKMLFYPFGFWSMRLMKIRGYDKVILSSTYASKYANIEKGIQIINYCHNPFRIAWYPDSYNGYFSSKGLKKVLFEFVIKKLKKIDYKYTRRCQFTLTNSSTVEERIRKIYHLRTHAIINPPVNLNNFEASGQKDDVYLVVSRLEQYKKVDLVVEVFKRNRKKLIVVGNGSQKEFLKKISGPNIIFKHDLSKEDLLIEYGRAKALIFPQLEDFGITPLESNASGTPVIAYGKGGVLETMIPYPKSGFTSVFFMEQTVEAIDKAIKYFESIEQEFFLESMVSNAAKFSNEEFSKKIMNVVNSI